ncbi:MAG: hypothetical protein AAGJ93_12050 [Bacteroidota bacterium]
MIELKNKYGLIYYKGEYDAQNGWVHTQWIGFVPSEMSIKGVEGTLQLLKESRCGKLLSDNSKIKGAWGETNDWLEKHWFEKASEYGLRKHATILPADLFSQSSHEQFEKSRGDSNISMKNFDSEEAARQWLKQ